MPLRSPLFLLAVLLAAPLLAAPARAELPRPGDWLERTNRWVHALNQDGGRRLAAGWDSLGLGESAAAPVVAPVAEALGRMLHTLVNEPVGMVSHAVAGDMRRLGETAARFAINTTLGIGGLFDRAQDYGFAPSGADLGLALCRHGVPAGPFVVVPVLGPRMLRDAVSDVVLSNLIILALLSPLAGPVLSPGAVLAIAVLDEVAVLALARRLDPEAATLAGLDYDAMRLAYQAQRALRCAEPAAAG